MSAWLDVRNLSVTFRSGTRVVHAVRDVSLQVAKGEVVALVGESGSGKSTFARAVAGLVAPSAGTIAVDGRDLATVSNAERRVLRRRIQMVFQDPDASLNPLHRIGTIVAEPMVVAGGRDRDAVRARVRDLLQLVRLDEALLDRRARQLSGGQKQRVAIARALAADPDLLIADEALSALDVSTQAAVAALFRDVGRRLGLGMLFISHDLATVRRLAHRVVVMYGGAVVESGTSADVLDAPAHPYTRLLVAAMPDPARGGFDFGIVDAIDELPALADAPDACHYRPRCLRREEVCSLDPALLHARGSDVHVSRCHFRDDPAGARARREGGR